MNWTEVTIATTTEGIETVTGNLLLLGINGASVTDSQDFEAFLNHTETYWDAVEDELMALRDCETTVTVYLPEDEQGAAQLRDLDDMLARLRAEDTEGVYGRLERTAKTVHEEDWANEWRKYFKPFTVGERFLVKPSWEALDEPTDRTVLEIDPGSSFGTGQHHTTQLCMELMEGLSWEDASLLDIGTGSGILAIAGLLLGARDARGIDIDLHAVETSVENVRKNVGADAPYEGFCGDIVTDRALQERIGGAYEVITANIIADVILGLRETFLKNLKKGGTLIVSGIIDDRADEVEEGLKEAGFTLIERTAQGGWVAMEFTR